MDTSVSAATLPPLLTQREAAEHLGVSVRTLYNWAQAGRGPSFTRIGQRGLLYERGELDAFKMGAAR